MTKQVADILVDCPGIEDLLTYQIPPDRVVAVGDIVTVPFGKRIVSGIVMELLESSELELREIFGVVNTSILPTTYWELLQKTSDYYCTPLIQTVRAALPPKFLNQSHDRVKLIANYPTANLSTNAQIVWDFLKSHAKKGITKRYLLQKLTPQAAKGLRELQQSGLAVIFLEPPQHIQPKTTTIVTLMPMPVTEITDRYREILITLERMGGEASRSELIKAARTTAATIGQLEKQGYVAMEQREVLRFGNLPKSVPKDQPKLLNPEQQNAFDQIAAVLGKYQEILLYGVTGSGKTEVYLQTIAQVLQHNKSALVLVPEIGLTPQLTDRFCHRFGNDRVLIYHSQLSEGERFDTWRYVLTGESKVIIGTRSAVFLPISDLGVIILDEEHDSSFKQDQPQPCYHARKIAQWRSIDNQCPLILGSATPCAETLWKAQQNEILRLNLPNRIGNRPMPPISIVDMREEFSLGNYSLFSLILQKAIGEMLEQKKQGILFVPRRGHNTFVSCRSCGFVVMCPNCDVSLSYHLTPSFPEGQLICHYCNFRQIQPERCPQCSSGAFRYFGAGTQRVLAELTKLYPEARVIRFDSDTTRNKDQHRQLLTQFQQQEADLLIGTQMITKGIDIPQVTLVGVLAADGLLNFSDYRASERAFQLLLQVAGRAGRGEDQGTIVIQTYAPDHPVINGVQNYDYLSFMQEELQHRQEFGYPPQSQMGLIILSSIDNDRVAHSAQLLVDILTKTDRGQILGPAPASIYRVANRYRWQILVKVPPETPNPFPGLAELRQHIPDKNIKITIDVDPLNIL